jgi:hypothetical protein
VSSWQGTIHDFRWPSRHRDVNSESTIGAHRSFKLYGHDASEKRAWSEKDAPFAERMSGREEARPMGMP